jgi:uncharacterized membrane protein YkvA (DUF1232 family)
MRKRGSPAKAAKRAAAGDPKAAQVLLPILKRLPRYVRLGWALGKEPSIPKRHKVLLFSAALYPVSPASLVMAVIPVVGQADVIVLFLLGIRQALKHCPPETAAQILERAGLEEGQLDEDLSAVGKLVRRAARNAGQDLGSRLRYGARVAGGFARRAAQRMAES